MINRTLLQTISIFADMPIHIYNENGECIDKYEKVSRLDNEYERNLTKIILQMLDTEIFVFHEFENGFPVAMYGCKSTKERYILGPFAYAQTENEKLQKFMNREGISDFPRIPFRNSILSIQMLLNEIVGEEEAKKMMDPYLTFDEDQHMVIEELRQEDN